MYTADQQLIIIIIQIKKGFKCRNFCALSEPFVRSVRFFFDFLVAKFVFLYGEPVRCLCPMWGNPKHCWILDFTTWNPDSMYCTCFLLVELVFWISIIRGILQAEERFSLIPNSTGRNPDSFTWGAIHFTATAFEKPLLRRWSTREYSARMNLDFLDCGS